MAMLNYQRVSQSSEDGWVFPPRVSNLFGSLTSTLDYQTLTINWAVTFKIVLKLHSIATEIRACHFTILLDYYITIKVVLNSS